MACLWVACHKDVSIELPPVPVGSNFLMVGDLSNAEIVYSDVLVQSPYVGSIEQGFDIDGDGNSDVRFVIRAYQSLGAGHSGHAYIAPMHQGMSLSGTLSNDTTYSKTVITVLSSSQWSAEVRSSYLYGCRPFLDSMTYSITAENPQLSWFEPGSHLSINSDFLTDSVRLIEQPTSSMLMINGVVNDTLYTSQYSNHIDCNFPPLDELTYLGFRLTTASGPALGWIMFTALDSQRIAIHQIAVQRQ